MEVKEEVKMDITPPDFPLFTSIVFTLSLHRFFTLLFYLFTLLPFYLFIISDILKFLTYPTISRWE